MRKRINIIKKIAAVTLSGLMLTGLAGCGSSTKPSGAVSSSLSSETMSGSLEGYAGTMTTSYSGYLGYGYNTVDSTVYTEDHIGASSCILDMNSLATNGFVYTGSMSSISTHYVYETKFVDVLEKIADDNGMSPGDTEFGGVLTELNIDKSEIKETEKSSPRASFIAYASAAVQTSREFIKTKDTSVLGDYVLDEFKKYVEKHSAEDIVKEYGTTVLTDVVLGGRFDLMYYMNELTAESADDIKKGISAYIEGVTDEAADKLDLEEGTENTGDFVNVNASSKKKYLTAFNNFADNCEKKGRVYGGSADINLISFAESADAFTNWSKTVADNSVVVGAKPGIPIWDIIETFNTDKAKEVKALFETAQEELKEEVTAE